MLFSKLDYVPTTPTPLTLCLPRTLDFLPTQWWNSLLPFFFLLLYVTYFLLSLGTSKSSQQGEEREVFLFFFLMEQATKVVFCLFFSVTIQGQRGESEIKAGALLLCNAQTFHFIMMLFMLGEKVLILSFAHFSQPVLETQQFMSVHFLKFKLHDNIHFLQIQNESSYDRWQSTIIIYGTASSPSHFL